MKYGWLAGLLSLTGCTLIDQRTFAPSPEADQDVYVQAPAAPVRFDSRAPLVVIDYAIPEPRYQDLLRMAVHAAEGRNGNVQYDVVAVLPDLKDSARGQSRAVSVMRDIMAEQVPAARVHLGLRAEPALAAGQVRVYVR